MVGHKKSEDGTAFLLDRSLLQQCYIMIAFSADIPRFSCLHEADDKALKKKKTFYSSNFRSVGQVLWYTQSVPDDSMQMHQE